MGGRKSMAVSAFGGKPSSLGARVLPLYHAQGVELLDVYLFCFFFSLFLKQNSTLVLFSVLHFSFLLIGRLIFQFPFLARSLSWTLSPSVCFGFICVCVCVCSFVFVSISLILLLPFVQVHFLFLIFLLLLFVSFAGWGGRCLLF